jgi:hypothetical protein
MLRQRPQRFALLNDMNLGARLRRPQLQRVLRSNRRRAEQQPGAQQ